jgi:hypothetical protein
MRYIVKWHFFNGMCPVVRYIAYRDDLEIDQSEREGWKKEETGKQLCTPGPDMGYLTPRTST